MLYRNNGIIAKGLGGSASNLILGRFNLGPALIEVIVNPKPKPSGGGASIPPSVRAPIVNATESVTIRVTVRGKVHEETYTIRNDRLPILIRVVSILNTVSTRISVVVERIRRLVNKIRIK